MHALFQQKQLSQPLFRSMSSLFEELHHQAKYLEIVSFRREFKLMLLEERDNYRLEFFPPEDLIPITMLMVRAGVFLEIDTPASEEFLQCREDFFVALDEFYVEFWLYDDSPGDLLLCIWISHVNREASFTIYEPDNIFGTKILF